MKKVLVPTDFSEQSINAIKAAASIAKGRDTEVILLHILDLPSQTVDMIQPGFEIPEIMFFKKQAEKRLIEMSKIPDLEGLTVSVVLRLGNTFDEVSKVANENLVDLIVMGSHGASGMKEYFIGSNTEKVVRTSDIPVLVIKGNRTNITFSNVVFASDFLEKNHSAYKKILGFLNERNAKPHFLMVNTPSGFKSTKEAERIIDEFLTDLDIHDYQFSVFNDYKIDSGIANYAERVDADLVVMGTHGRTGLSKFFNGSVSEDLVNHSNRNIITFKI